MCDTNVLKITKINIHSIGAEQDGGSHKSCINMHTVHGDEPKQETGRAEKCYTNMDRISKSNNKTRPMVKSNSYKTIEYFLSGLSYENDKKRSVQTTQEIYKDKDLFIGIRYFDGTFSLQLKPDSKPYHMPPRCMAYALQKPFQEELEMLQNQDIIAPLGLMEHQNGTTALC